MKPKLFRALPMLALAMAALMPYSRANADAVTDKL